MTGSNWDKRVRRVEELLARDPSGSQVLAFCGHLLALQQEMRQTLDLGTPAAVPISTPLRGQLNVDLAMAWLPRLLDVVQRHGPAKLAQEADRIRSAGAAQQRQMLSDFLQDGESAQPAPAFFARVLFQPQAEYEAARRPLPSVYTAAVCPKCGGGPQLAVLRPEGDGGKRHLTCWLCLTEWEFRRVICPVCEETDHTKLPRYSPDDPIAVRVEACDTCKNYLKSFDMTVDGLLVPEVDEIASIALDVWAIDHGYHKIQLNLLGF